MNCKYCGAPLNGDETVCPACGKPVEKETAAQTPAETETPEETVSAGTPEENGAPEKKKSQKTATLVIGILAVLAVIAVLVVLLVQGKKSGNAAASETQAETTAVTETTGSTESAESAGESGAESQTETAPAVSYTKDDASAFDEALLSQVVATCGESTLTNQKLAYYFWREYYYFLTNYGSYVSYVMDPSARLDSQTYDTGTTWEQMFLNTALNTYSTCAAAAQAAKAEGYQLTADEQSSLDGMETTMADTATKNGFESADAYLQQYFGPYCTMASYRTFMEEYMMGASYLQSKLSAETITDDDLETYYENNLSTYQQNGLEKDDTLMVNVRHILIKPDEVTLKEGDDGYDAAVQAAKDAAKAKAEQLYEQWKSGDQTEDSFAQLAVDNSQDTGSSTNGGLYENLAPGKTVQAFNDWCFDQSRKSGDTGIVETEYGYHILYFVSTGTESYWHSQVYKDCQSDRYNTICQGIMDQYPTTSDLTKAALYPCNTKQQ